MTLGSTNVSLNDIQNEYGGSSPISMSEYYRGGSYVIPHGNNTGIPSSGQISVSQFLSQNRRWVVSVTISGNTSDFNLRNYLNSAYGSYGSAPTDVTVTINSGVYLTSSSTAVAAFDTGTPWEGTSTITIYNSGYILGRGGDGGSGSGRDAYTVYYGNVGGAGGNAINLQHNVTIYNYGYIFGGGGGGGGGASFGMVVSYGGSGNRYIAGGGGGGGAGGSSGGGSGWSWYTSSSSGFAPVGLVSSYDNPNWSSYPGTGGTTSSVGSGGQPTFASYDDGVGGDGGDGGGC